MQPHAKPLVRKRANSRPGQTPGRLALRAKKPSRSRARKEGWDEHFMIWFTVVLALIVAAMTVYQTIAWAQL